MGEKDLPKFDERGCLPEGIYNPTIKEFKERFVAVSERRQELFGKYKEFTKFSNTAMGIEEHYVDGSFVTNKENPGDIDLLVTYNDQVYDTEESYDTYFELRHNQEKIKEEYEIHLFTARNPKEWDPIEVQVYCENQKNVYLEWWSRFYINRETNEMDDKKKGFIVFKEEELEQIEDW